MFSIRLSGNYIPRIVWFGYVNDIHELSIGTKIAFGISCHEGVTLLLAFIR